jgi:hypothetical protein
MNKNISNKTWKSRSNKIWDPWIRPRGKWDVQLQGFRSHFWNRLKVTIVQHLHFFENTFPIFGMKMYIFLCKMQQFWPKKAPFFCGAQIVGKCIVDQKNYAVWPKNNAICNFSPSNSTFLKGDKARIYIIDLFTLMGCSSTTYSVQLTACLRDLALNFKTNFQMIHCQ